MLPTSTSVLFLQSQDFCAEIVHYKVYGAIFDKPESFYNKSVQLVAM